MTGRISKFTIVDPSAVAELLICYKESFLDTLVDCFIEMWEFKNPKSLLRVPEDELVKDIRRSVNIEHSYPRDLSLHQPVISGCLKKGICNFLFLHLFNPFFIAFL
jgi:hypothetical protein